MLKKSSVTHTLPENALRKNENEEVLKRFVKIVTPFKDDNFKFWRLVEEALETFRISFGKIDKFLRCA